jgi:hypothetical protein
VADEKPPPEFMNVLGTEYFVLQSTASSTIAVLCDLALKAPLPAAGPPLPVFASGEAA